MTKKIAWLLTLVMVFGSLTLLTAGCGKKEVASPGGMSAEEKAKLEAERMRRLREQGFKDKAAQMREIFVNQDIHFDYDRYDLSTEAKQILNEKAKYMQDNPSLLVIVEGHCDERGSNAYNMALGERRAQAAAAYLSAMGIAPSRMEKVSYGEERPLVMGSDGEAFSANRRAHFLIK